MSGGDFRGVYFSDTNIKDLRKIKDDWDFLVDAEMIVDQVMNTSALTKEMADQANRELEKLRRALEGLSPVAKTSLFISHQRYSENTMYDVVRTKDSRGNDFPDLRVRVNNPVDELQVALLGKHKGNRDKELPDSYLEKTLTNRLLLGKLAYAVLCKHGIHAGTYVSGEFTLFLDVILDACRLDHDAHKLARDVLK